jgi:hypothetical protein
MPGSTHNVLHARERRRTSLGITIPTALTHRLSRRKRGLTCPLEPSGSRRDCQMPLVVPPRYRWLNTLLACFYAVSALTQIVQAAIGPDRGFHFALAALLGFLAYKLQRVAPWAYLAVFFLCFFALVAILKNLAMFGIYGFIALLLAAGIAWCAIFIRQNLVVPMEVDGASAKQ